jgi:hypothetical protein
LHGFKRRARTKRRLVTPTSIVTLAS